MNTMHFKYAVEVEKTGSISKAADNLFMAQPNLSKAIKELEDTLGIVIFARTSKGVVPTEQGKEFLEYAKQILVQIDKMESIYAQKEKREQCQELKLSVPRGSYISVAFSNFIAQLRQDKGMDITIQETNSMQTISNIIENGFHIGVIRYQTVYENYFVDYLNEKGLDSELLWEFSCLVLLPKSHKMANEEVLDFQKLRETSVELVHGDNVVPYLSMPEMKQLLFDDKRFQAKRIYVYERGSQFDLLTRVPETFMLVSPMPQELLDRYDLVQRRCVIRKNHFKDVLIFPRGYALTEIEKLFLNKLYEVKNEIAFRNYE